MKTAKLSDGGVVPFDERDVTFPPTRMPFSNLRQVALMDESGCGITADDDLVCWGNEPYNLSQPLDGGFGALATPRTVASLSSVTQVEVAGPYSCALLHDGAAYCWGRNDSGAIGDGTFANRPAPTRVTLQHAEEISARATHNCARDADKFWCWGSNHSGELGSGNADEKRPVPKEVVF